MFLLADLPDWVPGAIGGTSMTVFLGFIIRWYERRSIDRGQAFEHKQGDRDKAWGEMEKVVAHARADCTRLESRVNEQQIELTRQGKEIMRLHRVNNKCEIERVRDRAHIEHLESELRRSGMEISPYTPEDSTTHKILPPHDESDQEEYI